MNPVAGAAARFLLAALLVFAWATGCGDGEVVEAPATAPGGRAAAGGSGAGGGPEGGAAGEGGAGMAGMAGSGTACTKDSDCEPLGECYSVACEAGVCVGSARTRGGACSQGFCNGFARCIPCLDEAPRGEKDPGCSRLEPFCDEFAAEPRCVACEEDSDCDDGIECTVDRCKDSACRNDPWPLGSPCSGGLCSGKADRDSCVRCVDDKSVGFDFGCTPELPVCDTTQSPAVCAGCNSSKDCDDENECTSESCEDGVCERQTLPSGATCSLGYCNGISGAEFCVPRHCQTAADCDDHAACTEDACEDGYCAFTTDDSQCPDSGDVCNPNVCSVGTGCQSIDVSDSSELLSNGDLDAGNVDWVEMSEGYPQVIFPYDYVPTLFPHTPVYIAWLAGGEAGFEESDSLSQEVAIPKGTVRLELTFFYQVWADDLADDTNQLDVTLRASASSQSAEPIVTFHNQDETRVWTRFSATIDGSDWAGEHAVLEFHGIQAEGFTAFFVDSISLVATVCE